MTRTPVATSEHGTKVWCEVGDTEVDVELPCTPPCVECINDLVKVRRVIGNLGLLDTEKPLRLDGPLS